MSDIDAVVVDSLKALDPERPLEKQTLVGHMIPLPMVHRFEVQRTLPPRSTAMEFRPMTRRAACSCGQLHLTIEGRTRGAHFHVRAAALECQRRTGAVISNQARFPREQVTIVGKATTWMRTAESGNALTFTEFLSDMRLHCLLGERRLSWIRRCCYRQLRQPKFPRADYRGVGGVTPLLVLLAAQHAAQARGEAGVVQTTDGLSLTSAGCPAYPPILSVKADLPRFGSPVPKRSLREGRTRFAIMQGAGRPCR